MKIINYLPKIQQNISLKLYTSFKIGGPARYFCQVNSKEQLIESINFAKKLKIPYFILGKGSNILVSDNGYQGLIIKIKILNLEIKNLEILTGSGVLLRNLVDIAEKRGLSGLEWMAGIPGSVGGAIRGNAGAFDGSIKHIIKKVEALKIGKNKIEIKNFNNKECQFSYRNSIFKQNKNLIILSCQLKLKKEGRKKIKNKITKYLNYRKEHHPLNFPSAGSIFKNIGVTNRHPVKSSFHSDHGADEFTTNFMNKEIPAGLLIEKCGLKGFKIGGAMVSEKHANFIINTGKATAKEIVVLINLIKQKVKNKFGLQLQEEIEYLGFD